MKRIISILITILFVISAFGCSKEQEPLDLYSVMIVDGSKSIASADTKKIPSFSMAEKSYINENLTKEKTLTIGDTVYEATYKESISAPFVGIGEVDVYMDANKDIELGFSSDDASLLRIISNDPTRPIVSFSETITSESQYITWLNPVVEKFLKVDLSDYIFECQTHVKGGETKNGFIVDTPNSDIEVVFYSIEYAKYTNNNRVIDRIRALISSNGDVTTIVRADLRIKDDSIIEIDETKLDNSIDKTLKDMYSDSKYDLISYEISEEILKIYDNNIFLVCGISLKLSHKKETLSSKIILAVNLTSNIT